MALVSTFLSKNKHKKRTRQGSGRGTKWGTKPEGKAGNLKLARPCFYCVHKLECHKEANDGKGLRAFKYSKGLTYLTKVVRLPNVPEASL